MIYTIKCITTYEIEADDDQEAREYYYQGLWDVSDSTDEVAIELGTRDENGDYKVLEHI